MPLYQMLCIAVHYGEYKYIKDLVTTAAKHVMKEGGVVRNLDSWGTLSLPQRMKAHGNYHTIGDYWTMNFDASPQTLRSLSNAMRTNPRVVRWTMLKLGDRVQDVVKPKTFTIQP